MWLSSRRFAVRIYCSVVLSYRRRRCRSAGRRSSEFAKPELAAVKSPASQRCCRTFGPHYLLFDMADLYIHPHKGNPLGKGPLWLPEHLLRSEPATVIGCPAGRYKPCTVCCLLCRGIAGSRCHHTLVLDVTCSYEYVARLARIFIFAWPDRSWTLETICKK